MLRGFRTSRLYLALSLILGVAAALLVRSYATGLTEAAGGRGPAVPVVVAAVATDRGNALVDGDLRIAEWPRSLAPPGALRQISQAAGRIALTDLAPGEAVTETRLARVREGPVASLVPQGLRALAVPTSLPAGSVVAGDHVDVLATYQGDRPYTETVASGVEVLLVIGDGTSSDPLPAAMADDVGLDAVSGGAGGMTLVLLVPVAEQTRLASARAFANLEVTIAPAGG